MAGLPDAVEIDLLKLLTGQATAVFTTTPYTPYVGLFTVTPTDSAAGTEATGGGYARINSAGLWDTPVAGSPSSVSNDTPVELAEFTGTVSAGAAFVAFGLFTAVTAGTLITYGLLTDQTKTGAAGDQIVFDVGDLTVTAD